MAEIPRTAGTGITVRVRTPSGMAFFIVGAASIVLGGLAAAVTSPLGWAHGAWVAAYLVLVTGAAQVALGIGQDHFTDGDVSGRLSVAELVGLNIGSAGVIVGTLVPSPWIVDIGGLLVLVALALMLVAVQGARLSAAVVIYRLVIVLLVISIPIGLVLAYLDAGAA